MRKVLVFASALLCSSAPAAAQMAHTPSGQPEVAFNATTVTDAEGKIASACMDRGWTVTAQTANEVTCQIPFGGFKQALAGALLGNAYSTPPNVYAQFNLAQVGDNVRAQAHAWMETQMAFGQVRQMAYTDDKTKTGLMSLMASAGGSLPDGTTFTGNYLGIDNNPSDQSALTLTHVFSGTPAADAGLNVGDQITAINGKGFKNPDDFGKRLNKIKEPTYTITVNRQGQSMTFTVQRRGRPAVGTPEYAALMAEAKTEKK